MTRSAEYALIEQVYGTRRAKRSGVLLMRHIDEGLEVLRQLDASELAVRAYCLHPLVQADAELLANIELLGRADPRCVAVTMEYRHVANGYLSQHGERPAAAIDLGPLSDVADMLRADKVQNYKDFLRYHRDTHPRAAILDRYFRTWLERLDVSLARFEQLVQILERLPSPP